MPIDLSMKDENGRMPRGVYRGLFYVNKPSDTYLNFESWGKGLVYVNGHPMGRIWEIGPQQTLYMPGCWLKKGENEILVFDIIGPESPKSEGIDYPVLDRLSIAEPVTHRAEGEALDLNDESPVIAGEFNPGNGWQEIRFATPATGRYICIEGISAIDGKELASIAELYLIDNNGRRLSRENWTVMYADSEDVKTVNRAGDKVFDLQESTYWQTVPGDAFPHALIIDLGNEYSISGLQILPRMESGAPGAIKEFKVYLKSSPFNVNVQN